MWRWDQGRLLYFQFDVLRDIAKALTKFDNTDISACEDTFRNTLVSETGMPFLPTRLTTCFGSLAFWRRLMILIT